MDMEADSKTALPTPPERLYEMLEEAGIEVEISRHPPVFTVEEAKKLRGILSSGAHVKNLFLRNKKEEMWLLVAKEDTDIDLKALGTVLEAGRLSFGSAERLMRVLGVFPGSVTPLAIVNDKAKEVRLVLEEGLLQHERIHCHPLVNDQTISIRTKDLLRFVEIHGHSPMFLAL